MTKALKLD